MPNPVDQRTGEAFVSFKFNTSGARKFAQATADNVGQPFAIVLDNKVISAPVIREPITGGQGQISGSFTVQSANDLAILMRAGALPAPLTVVEERTVGPGLGQDSIEADIEAVRSAAAALGKRPLVIAKIERAGALQHFDEILAGADGIMVARGDLGVELPFEEVPLQQKRIIGLAARYGRPVITATQMLESMVEHRRPTRAEATDVANAILDGTDAVMLSAESAMGAWPVEAVAMLARIAAEIEPHRSRVSQREALRTYGHGMKLSNVDLVAVAVTRTFEHAEPAAVIVPTISGTTARSIARFRLPVWTIAASPHAATCRGLQFSYALIIWKNSSPPKG